MNHRNVLPTIFVLLALLMGASQAGAQAGGPNAPSAALGTGFTYQGQLTSGGSPLTGNCDLAFRLYGVASGGSPVGSPITQTVAVANSQFTVALDFGAGVFDGSARWLDMQVRCPAGSGGFTQLSPRQALTAAPYALYALNAATAQTAVSAPNAWSLTGNAGTTAANFLGTTTNVTLTLRVSNTAVMRYVPNAISPNIIGGYSGNVISPTVRGGVIGGGGSSGAVNKVTADYGTVSGGSGNRTSATGASVAGGQSNIASGYVATVGGGTLNTASNDYATVGGGYFNTASGLAATVGGGGMTDQADAPNTASGTASTVGGGAANLASGPGATIGGGGFDGIFPAGNVATGIASTVGGGVNNQATSYETTVAGGDLNLATNTYAAVGGGFGNHASAPGATVGGGGFNGTTNGGNTASGKAATVAGGYANIASGDGATIGGGGYDSFTSAGNTAAGGASTVAGGVDNHATIYGATVGGGGVNSATNTYAAVGGYGNLASGHGATIGGGGFDGGNYSGNTAAGNGATVPGGLGNSASGNYSFAAGKNAHAVSNGAFVWADLTGAVISSTAADQFLVRASGGVTLYTNSTATAGATLAAGSSSWSMVSDRNLKANFAGVDGLQVLDALAGIPIQTWNYQSQAAAIRHIGPMAQDFYAAFGVGENDTTISTVDAQGVALAAIQGMYGLVKDQSAQIDALQQQNAEQQQVNADLQARLAALEQKSSGDAPPLASGVPVSWLLAAGLAGAAFWLGGRRSRPRLAN